ncbi:MAG TPA: hypothetical protein VJ476_04310 [Rhizomicrobium sp.]|nr:hypothetical protein [Rhizomicrobium sp.]
MVRTAWAILAVLMSVLLPAAAATHVALQGIDDQIVVPDHSSLVFERFDKDNITVHFTGKTELAGTYYYGAQAIDDGSNSMSVYFRPDRTSMVRLPAFRDHGRPDDIFVTNPAAFVRAVLPRMKTRPTKSYASGHVTIIVDRFEASIECDAPNFSARFVSVVAPAPMRMAQMPDSGC